MKSPLRYPGGKTRAINILKDFIPEGTKKICSPFLGGASFELYLASKGVAVYGYDNFKPLVSFWRALKYDKEDLIGYVKYYFDIKSAEMFKKMQSDLTAYMHFDDTIQGAMFYILNRCSFSGTTLSGGMSPGTPRFTERQIEQLQAFNLPIRFHVEHLPFEQSIKKHSCLVYADPPYIIDSKLYGSKGDLHTNFNHKLLADILNERGNFILCYNNCNEVKELYKNHKFYYPAWCYGMSNDKTSKEILIISNDV